MKRITAFGTHLAISAVIFAGLAYLVLFVWYPDLFFATDGGWQGMRIIIFVDLVLGPLLTLIVFKAGKPGLKFDLTCIGIFQLVCLAAGTWLVFSERPIAIVYADGQFTSVNADTYIDAGMDVPDLSRFPGPSPKWLMVEIPEDINEQADLRRQMFAQQKILALATDRYKAFDQKASDFVSQPYDVEKLIDRDQVSQQIPMWLARYGGTLADYRFYPFGSRYNYVFLGYRANGSQLLGVLETPAPV